MSPAKKFETTTTQGLDDLSAPRATEAAETDDGSFADMSLPQHLEKYLGTIQGGWSQDADGGKMPFQVVEFERGPRPDTVAFSTLGLSKTPLHSSATGKTIHHELLIALPESMRHGPAPGILQQIGQEALANGHALLRGDVIGPHRALVSNDSQMEALYASPPVYFPDELATYREDDRDVVMVWLIPITRAEAVFVRMHGWNRFEDELVRTDANLIDPGRTTVLR